MADIRIYDVPDDQVQDALRCAINYAMQYPDRVGVSQICVYTHERHDPITCHRTKRGQIVARGTTQ